MVASVQKSSKEKTELTTRPEDISRILITSNLLNPDQLKNRHLIETAEMHIPMDNIESLSFASDLFNEQNWRLPGNRGRSRSEYLEAACPSFFIASTEANSKRYDLDILYVNLNSQEGIAFLQHVKGGIEKMLKERGKEIEGAYQLIQATANMLRQSTTSTLSRSMLESVADNLEATIPSAEDKSEGIREPTRMHEYLTREAQDYDLLKTTYLPRIDKLLKIMESGELEGLRIVIPMLALPEKESKAMALRIEAEKQV